MFHGEYPLFVMYIRFGLAHTLCATAYAIGSLAIRALPKNHPSRLYLKGRICDGRRKMRCALSREAAKAAVSESAPV